jgi:hypothetical protein
MEIQGINNINFGNKKIYQRTIRTSYGRCIEGGTDKHEYYIYTAENPVTNEIKHKLYVVNNKTAGNGKERWVKSFLRFFDKDKLTKELRSNAR